MRIGASLLLLNGVCYQSYRWEMLRPLGSLQNAVSHLEQYQIDEIAIIRPVRESDTNESLLKDITALQQLITTTPISFGGGVRDMGILEQLTSMPVERLILSSAFFNANQSLLKEAAALYGHQAIQAMIPFKKVNGQYVVYHCSEAEFTPAEALIQPEFFQTYANEIVLYDVANEGVGNTFDFEALDVFSSLTGFRHEQLIIGGGVGADSIKSAYSNNLAAVSIENRVLHKEYSIEALRHA